MAKISLPIFLHGIFDALTRLWAYLRNLESRYHKLFLYTSVFGVVRLAIHLASTLFSYIHSAALIARSAVNSSSGASSGLSFLTYFDLANAIFPVYELFVFLSTVLTLKSALWVYCFIRAAYKNIPLKFT